MSLLRACFFVMLLSSLVALAVSQEWELSSRMPMHKTQGIFDLLPSTKILKFLGKFFRAPLRLLKSGIKPFMNYVRIAWSWAGRGTTVPGMSRVGARSIDRALDWFSDHNIDAFFDALEV